MTPNALILLLIAGFSLLAAVNVQSGWLFLVGYSLLALVMTSLILGKVRLNRLRVHLSAPEQSEAGGEMPLALWLSGPCPLIACMVPPLGRRPRRRLFFSNLVPAGWSHGVAAEAGDLTLSLPTPNRGEYPLPSVVLACAPLGLWTSTRTVPVEGKVLVLPKVHRLLSLPWLRTYRGDGDGSPRPQVGGELFRTIRDYQSGDSLRQIHWKSTAKRGSLMVKESDTDQGFTAVKLVIDPVGPPLVVEQVFSVAASLAAHLERRGIACKIQSSEGIAPKGLEAQLRWLALHPVGGACPPAKEAILVTGRSGEAAFTIQCGHGEGLACPPGADIPRVLGGE